MDVAVQAKEQQWAGKFLHPAETSMAAALGKAVGLLGLEKYLGVTEHSPHSIPDLILLMAFALREMAVQVKNLRVQVLFLLKEECSHTTEGTAIAVESDNESLVRTKLRVVEADGMLLDSTQQQGRELVQVPTRANFVLQHHLVPVPNLER